MNDPKKVLYYVFTAVGITAFVGAFILFGMMYLMEKFDLIFVPFILIFVGIAAFIVASVARSKLRKQMFESNISQQMKYNADSRTRVSSPDPFFTIDPFADAFGDDSENKKESDANGSTGNKFCINCGAPRVKGDTFCPYCGKKYE